MIELVFNHNGMRVEVKYDSEGRNSAVFSCGRNKITSCRSLMRKNGVSISPIYLIDDFEMIVDELFDSVYFDIETIVFFVERNNKTKKLLDDIKHELIR